MIVLEAREFPRPPAAPSWWRTETERRFERLRPLQEKVLSLLGMTDDEGRPTPPARGKDLPTAADHASMEQRRGDAWSLPVPIYRDEEHGGFHLAELIVRRGANAPFEEQRLWQLAEVAGRGGPAHRSKAPLVAPDCYSATMTGTSRDCPR